jgi:hypothetical protein
VGHEKKEKKIKKISTMQTISMIILQHVCLISLNHKHVIFVVPIHAFYFTPIFILTPGTLGKATDHLRRVSKRLTNTGCNTDYTSVGPEFADGRYKN